MYTDMSTADFETAISRAIQNNEFVLYYQPSFSVEEKGAQELEALIRWQTPEGLLSPFYFLPRAEDLGIISHIGKWVFENVCKDISTIFSGNDVPVTVNFSNSELRMPNFLNYLLSTIKEYNIDPQKIMLEISEEIIASDLIFYTKLAKQLTDCGFLVGMDNFGKKNTCLKSLADVNFRNVKFDNGFLFSAKTNNNAYQIVSGLASIIRSIGTNVYAEKIENEEQLDYVRQLGINLIQGYYFSTPLTAEDAVSLYF